MKPLIHVAAAASLLLLAACGGSEQPAPAPAPSGMASGSIIQLPAAGEQLETINGVAVPESLLEAIAKGRGLDLSQAAQKQRALDELQQYVLLAQQASILKVQDQPDLAAMVEAARLQGVANAVLLAYARQHPVTDAQVAKEYQQQVAQVGDKTYQITNLLFADQATADQAAAELAAGKSFDEVFDAYRDKARDAKAYPALFLKQLPPELAGAVAALEPGHATPKPVKSSLGWHLIFLNAMQAFQPPALDKVAAKIREGLQQEQAQAYLESLKANATITLLSPARTASAAPAGSPPAMGKAVSKRVVHDAAPAPASSAQ